MTKPELPFYFISGHDDPCRISDQKFLEAVELMKKIGYYDVEYRYYEGARHEILNDFCKEQVFLDVVEWMERHVLK